MKKKMIIILISALLLTGCAPFQKFPRKYHEGVFSSQLTVYEQEVYQKMYDMAYEGDECMYTFENSKAVQNALYAFVAERPQFFWIELSQYYYSYLFNYTFYSVFSDNGKDYNLETMDKVYEVVDEIIKEAEGLNDYDKLKYFHDYIINHTYYQLESKYSQDVRSVFLNHESVCAGYAKAFQLLANRAGYECYTVTGFCNEARKKKDSHAWNLVKLDDVFYWVDVTFDEVIGAHGDEYGIRYEYFLADDFVMKDNHFYSDKYSFEYPKCTDDRYSYYKLNNCYFTSHDKQAILDYMITSLENGENSLTMRFADYDIYCEAVDEFFMEKGKGKGFDNLIKELYPGVKEINYQISKDKNIYKILIFGLEYTY